MNDSLKIGGTLFLSDFALHLFFLFPQHFPPTPSSLSAKPHTLRKVRRDKKEKKKKKKRKRKSLYFSALYFWRQ